MNRGARLQTGRCQNKPPKPMCHESIRPGRRGLGWSGGGKAGGASRLGPLKKPVKGSRLLGFGECPLSWGAGNSRKSGRWRVAVGGPVLTCRECGLGWRRIREAGQGRKLGPSIEEGAAPPGTPRRFSAGSPGLEIPALRILPELCRRVWAMGKSEKGLKSEARRRTVASCSRRDQEISNPWPRWY